MFIVRTVFPISARLPLTSTNNILSKHPPNSQTNLISTPLSRANFCNIDYKMIKFSCIHNIHSLLNLKKILCSPPENLKEAIRFFIVRLGRNDTLYGEHYVKRELRFDGE